VLKDSDSDIQSLVALTLGDMGDTRAIEPLIAVLKDRNSDVRQAAAKALEGLGWEPPDEEHKGWYLVGKLDWEGCVLLGGSAVKPLIAILKDDNEDVRLRAAEALGKLGDARAITPLVTALLDHIDRDEGMQSEVVAALDQLGTQLDNTAILVQAMEPLIAAFWGNDYNMRQRAVQVLGMLDTRVVEPLIAALSDNVESLMSALEDSDSDVRSVAVLALGRSGNPRAIELLIPSLQDNDEDVRLLVAWVLGKSGDSRAIEPLITILEDSDEDVRETATEALEEMGWKPPD
jgi:HEAT repeat protein